MDSQLCLEQVPDRVKLPVQPVHPPKTCLKTIKKTQLLSLISTKSRKTRCQSQTLTKNLRSYSTPHQAVTHLSLSTPCLINQRHRMASLIRQRTMLLLRSMRKVKSLRVSHCLRSLESKSSRGTCMRSSTCR